MTDPRCLVCKRALAYKTTSSTCRGCPRLEADSDGHFRLRTECEIADLSGDPVQAIRFYRAALASWAEVGVKRRLHALVRAGWTAA